MPTGTLKPHVMANRVVLTALESSRAIKFGEMLHDKIIEHRKKRGTYKTNMTQGAKQTLEGMCRQGQLGEMAFRKYMDMELPETFVVGLDYFDGGVDCVVGDQKVAVKAALNPEKYQDRRPMLISPRNSNAINWHKCTCAALTLPHSDGVTVDMVGFIMRDDWRRLAKPFFLDPQRADSVEPEQLQAMHCLYLSEVWSGT